MYQRDIPLAQFSTLNVGGIASHYISVQNTKELERVIRENTDGLPICILGGGSNVLIPDEGWPGLLIHMRIGGIEWEDRGEKVCVTAGAGVIWDDLVEESVERGLYGLENLSLIPGTVGAAPIQNIGAYGAEVADVIKEVVAIDRVTGEKRVFDREECDFSYRDSFFKTEEGKRWIITHVSFLLAKEGELNTSYADVERWLDEQGISNPTLEDVRRGVVSIRRGKLPDLREYGTAGSFFKNPVITSEEYEILRSRYPELPGYEVDGGIKVSLAWILDHILGLKGYTQGNVGLYEHQPLVLVTKEGAQSSDVCKLADTVASSVYAETKINIEPEVTILRV
ncbi:MAG: UDP-N-acetylmuramate dehydrogenase [Candidatus Paceibacterota bacterium]